MINVTTTFTSGNPETIWNRLAAGLKRQPTNDEAARAVKHILRGGTLAAFIAIASATSAQAATPSACKGLEESVCGKTDSCTWTKAIVAGEAKKDGSPYKTSRKAHCRLKRPSASR